VLVTSLYLGISDVLSRMYMENSTADGSLVSVMQPTHENIQFYGVDVNMQAYTEILLLSFSDNLLVTPISTFGGSAQAYGALSPWFIEHREQKNLSSCQYSQTVEVCNQYTGIHFDCKYDQELGNKLFTEVVPDMEDCPQIEFPYRSENEQGIRLRTTFHS
jgi:xyloglucan fucosyltransferase